jgi:hypothetical protein
MNDMKRLTPLLALLSLVPLAVTAVAVFALLPNVVPLHVGLDGIDRYGSKFEAFTVGGVLSGSCLLFTFLFHKAERLNELGLIHGTGVHGGRICLLAGIALMDIMSVAVVFFWMSGA